MAGATEARLMPANRQSPEAMGNAAGRPCRAVPALCIPVTRPTILSHGKVKTTLGIAQPGNWDIARLAFDPAPKGAHRPRVLMMRRLCVSEFTKL
jgi:hypothetical protein